jgi:hypothetical protein
MIQKFFTQTDHLSLIDWSIILVSGDAIVKDLITVESCDSLSVRGECPC